MSGLFLLGRIIAGGYFIMSAVNHFTGLNRMAAHAAAQGVPMAKVAVALSGILLLVGGLSLLLGIVPRLGVAALAAFLIPVTFIMHRFWDIDGPRRMVEMVNFTKNMGLLGSILMFVAIPEPWPYSLGARVHLSRRHAEI
jgi:putative oxidoreductase